MHAIALPVLKIDPIVQKGPDSLDSFIPSNNNYFISKSFIHVQLLLYSSQGPGGSGFLWRQGNTCPSQGWTHPYIHSHTHSCLEQSIHLPASFFGSLEATHTNVARTPGAVMWQQYPLHHRATSLENSFGIIFLTAQKACYNYLNVENVWTPPE